jgi:hypothetical protein
MNNSSISNNPVQPVATAQAQPVISVAHSVMTGGVNGDGSGVLVVPIPSHAVEGFFLVLLAAFTAVILPGRK